MLCHVYNVSGTLFCCHHLLLPCSQSQQSVLFSMYVKLCSSGISHQSSVNSQQCHLMVFVCKGLLLLTCMHSDHVVHFSTVIIACLFPCASRVPGGPSLDDLFVTTAKTFWQVGFCNLCIASRSYDMQNTLMCLLGLSGFCNLCIASRSYDM